MEPENGTQSSQPLSANTAPEATHSRQENEVAIAFVAEARSIQELLHHYQQNSEELKKDLTGFVHREIDEHAKLSHLRASVYQAELESLKDSRYMEYIARTKKQRQDVAHAGTDVAEDGPRGGTSLPSKDPPSSSTDSTATDEVWWITELQRNDSAWLRGWIPDAAISLRNQAAVVQVWLGWKAESMSSADAFRGLVNKVYDTSAARTGNAEGKLNCFGNGHLCTIPVEVDARLVAAVRDKASDMLVQLTKDMCGEVRCEALSQRVAWAASAYNAALHEAVAMTRDNFCSCMWPKLESSPTPDPLGSLAADRLKLCGDAWDTLTFVTPARMQHTVCVRAFFFQGELGIVEQLGTEVDMSAVFLSAGVASTASEDHKTRVCSGMVRTLRAICAALTTHTLEDGSSAIRAGLVNMVLTVALKLPLGEENLFDGVLLDVHPATPQLPFEGRTTWMEVCAVGKQRSSARRGTVDSNVPAALSAPDCSSTEGVVFRLTYLPVASLQPYDTLSRQVFPLLNDMIHYQAAPDAEQKEESETDGIDKREASRPFLTSLVGGMTLFVGAACCTALAVGILRWVHSK